MKSKLTIIAYCFRYAGNSKMSMLFYNMALRVHNDPHAHNGIGNVHMKNGNYLMAEQSYNKAVDLNVEHALYNLALLRFRYMNDLDGCIELLKKSIEKDKYYLSMHYLGKLYFAERYDFRLAEKYFLMAIGRGNYRPAMFLLALLYENEMDSLSSVKNVHDESLAYLAHKVKVYYDMAIHRKSIISMCNMVVFIRRHKNTILFKLKHHNKNLISYNEASYCLTAIDAYKTNYSTSFAKKYIFLNYMALFYLGCYYGDVGAQQNRLIYINKAHEIYASGKLNLVRDSVLWLESEYFLVNNNYVGLEKLYLDATNRANSIAISNKIEKYYKTYTAPITKAKIKYYNTTYYTLFKSGGNYEKNVIELHNIFNNIHPYPLKKNYCDVVVVG